MIRKFTSLLAVMGLMFAMTACNSTTVSQRAETAISVAIAVAQAEAPLVPAADQAGYNGFVALAQSLDTQLGTCLSNVGLMSKSAKFLACFNTFAAGLASPAELAQLRLLNPALQARVQVYLAAIVAGVNIAVKLLGGTAVTAPSISPAADAYLHTKSAQLEYNTITHQMAVAAGI